VFLIVVPHPHLCLKLENLEVDVLVNIDFVTPITHSVSVLYLLLATITLLLKIDLEGILFCHIDIVTLKI
jgi:hypothetical protein